MTAAHQAQRSLRHLLAGLVVLEANQEREITGLALDSRRLQPGEVFFACRSVGGHSRVDNGLVHGLDYAVQAANKGAVAILYDVQDQARAEALMPQLATLDVAWIAVPNLQQQVGVIAARFYQEPTSHQFVIGITGTNGKTSCSHFLAQVLSARAGGCGLIGTLGYGLYGQLNQGQHTTPDAVQLQGELAAIHAAGAGQVVMEVSSHALDQCRTEGVAFDVAVLTNLSHEHLDYHADMERYAAAKQRLFQLPGLSSVVINFDDAFGRQLLDLLPLPNSIAASKPLQILSYGFDAGADVRAVARRFDADGFELQVSTPWGDGRLTSGLLGRFNASNLLAVLTTLLLMDMPLEQALASLGQVQPVTGRMQRFGGSSLQPLVVVDYAHTPDALQQVLQTLRELCNGQLWCVFGCGGERDRDKRPSMGAIAEGGADHVIITDDNPRHEMSVDIIDDILAGMGLPEQVVVQQDRAAAIGLAVQSAGPGDVVLVAGKGHESYQLVGGQMLPFSDQQQVAALLGEVA